MRHASGAVAGIILAGAVVAGGAAAPAQAASLPGLAKFGIASAGWVPLGATVASRVPGGLKGLCLLGKSCPTHLFTYGDDEGTVVYSVGRDRSESAAKKRLASARQVDTALFSAGGVALRWKKIKPGKSKSLKDAEAWQASANLDGTSMCITAIRYRNQVGYMLAGGDAGFGSALVASQIGAKGAGPLASIVKSKVAASNVKGSAKGFVGIARYLS